jgi:hypothetical protein
MRLVERARTKARGTPRTVMRAREIVAQLTDIDNEGKSPGVEKPLWREEAKRTTKAPRGNAR